MSKKVDYYQTLGISKSANNIEIKRAYKRLAIKYHPDHNQGNIKSEEKFKEIKEAYEVLIDPKKRSMYDQYGFESENYSNDTNDFYKNSTSFNDIFGDIFSDIFNTKSNKKADDIKYNLEIDLEDSVLGVKKEINIPILDICEYCKGSGSNKGKVIKCNNCNGSGQIQTKQGFFIVQQVCYCCNGNGKIIKDPCIYCNGDIYIKKNKNFIIKLPHGINDGDYIKISGKGNINNNLNRGDIYIYIKIKSHPIFTRENNNLYCEIPINFYIAALGGEIEIPTLNNKIKLKIPSETQNGKLFKIKGKGIKNYKNNYIGDLICKVIIETPINLNEKQKFFLKELGKSFLDSNEQENNPKYKIFFNKIKRFFNNI
ncbi:molecular chaperone DnaJ [Candidatus Nardonella dryophthoridicola]|uniref:Chaperone protein DnaJ n=1 Tax=endosymbiont of Metamasius hemipterus TaxID=204627 RepID=A0ABT0TX15_9GAMM|nr:molecular chaperone DnaJ [Candidatus Nardonella dryophthoridicola]MCM0158218.1 molecular chaperone DnaJ [endosymbiont of Metamasius hemipterus]